MKDEGFEFRIGPSPGRETLTCEVWANGLNLCDVWVDGDGRCFVDMFANALTQTLPHSDVIRLLNDAKAELDSQSRGCRSSDEGSNRSGTI